MKIPDSIRIGGVEYTIIKQPQVRLDNRICYGAIDYNASIITLSEADNPGHQMMCITLLHEVLHGICHHAGLEIKNEETVVDMFAKGLYQVLQDNGKRLFDIEEPEDIRKCIFGDESTSEKKGRIVEIPAEYARTPQLMDFYLRCKED